VTADGRLNLSVDIVPDVSGLLMYADAIRTLGQDMIRQADTLVATAARIADKSWETDAMETGPDEDPDIILLPDRCPSCEHGRDIHDRDGRCWHTIKTGVSGANLVCQCLVRGDPDEPVRVPVPDDAVPDRPDRSAPDGECWRVPRRLIHLPHNWDPGDGVRSCPGYSD
jgi:hypothetical protein